MALTAKFLADFTDFYSAVSKATSQLDGLQKEANESGLALNKMVTSLSGEKAIKDAMSLAAAVEALGGTSKLTAAELEKVGKKAAEAVEKAKALGVDVPPELQKLADANKKTTSSFDDGLGSITKWAVGLVSVTAAIELAKVGFSALIGFLSDSVKAAADAQAAQAQLTATMASHGVAVPEVIAAYQGYISALAKTTTQSDDALTASAALLTTMGVMPREMNAALTAATNLAERFGGGEQGLAKATEAVGKAAMGQTASLAKAGIQLDDTKVKAEGFSYVVTQVNEQLGGAAVAAANTYAGRLAQLGNAWDELQESVGLAIVQNQTVIDTINALSQAFTGANGSLAENRDVMNLVSDSVVLLVRAFGLLAEIVGRMAVPIRATINELKFFPTAAAKAVAGMLAIEKALVAIGAGNVDAVKKLESLQQSLEGSAASLESAAAATQGFIAFTARIGEETDELAGRLAETRGQTVALAAATNQSANAMQLSTTNVQANEAAQKAAARAAEDHARAQKKFEESVRGSRVATVTMLPTVRAFADEERDLLRSTDDLTKYMQRSQVQIGAWGQTVKVQVLPAVTGLKPALEEAAEATLSFGQTVSTYLSEDFGRTVVGALQGGGSVAKSAMAGLGNALVGPNSSLAKSLTSGIGKVFGSDGMMGQIGKSLGSFVPMIGPMLGPAIEGVTKLFSAVFGGGEESSQVSPLRDEFFKLQGGIESLNPHVEKLTGNFSLVQAVFDAKTVEDYNAAIGELTGLFQLEQDALAGVTEAAQRYGITLEELGPAFARQELDKKAQQLYKDFELLNAAGVKNSVITKKMADEVNKYVRQAVKMGVEVPSAMRPMLENMAKMGILTDASGKKVKDLDKAGVKFAMTMSEGFSKLIDSVDSLTNVLANSLGVELKETKKKVEDIPDSINIKVKYDDKGPPKISGGSIKGYQGGTKGFEDFGAGTLVMLHGREAVVPEHAVKSGTSAVVAAASPAPVTVIINAQGSFFDTPGDLQRLADKVNAALTAKHGLTNRLRAA